MVFPLLRRVCAFVRREVVLCAALFCAAASACFVPPSAAYIGSIDWNTLCILFALMGVVAALQSCGVFTTLGGVLCRSLRGVRSLSATLVALCFFFSMVITNDVALLTFVPFSIALLAPVAAGGTVMRVIILQTIAANTGSMLTPLGNPQNLFLFQQLNLPLGQFLAVMLPYTALSAGLLAGAILLLPRTGGGKSAGGILPAAGAEDAGAVPPVRHIHRREGTAGAMGAGSGSRVPVAARVGIYGALFALCLLAVFRVLPKPAAALAVFAVLLAVDRRILRRIDYMLLLTFAAFFVFTGNIAHIAPLRTLLEKATAGNEFAVGAAASQVISNVPATLLLYPFARDARSLLVGVNVGGLGTLVASLASLISYKLYAGAQKGAAHGRKKTLPSTSRYLAAFTVYNLLFLLALVALRLAIGG